MMMITSQTKFRYLKSKPAVVMVTQVIAAFYKAFGQTFIKEMINRIFLPYIHWVNPTLGCPDWTVLQQMLYRLRTCNF